MPYYPLPIGRFDLNSALMYCSNCKYSREAFDEDYVYSGWWPAKPGKDESANVFYDDSLLDVWYEIQNNTPGTSQEMFLRCLSEISYQHGRVLTIVYEFVFLHNIVIFVFIIIARVYQSNFIL
jgi:hypothetical protein